jgi:thiamine pyrophosphate-dependent acetolactate synthase large subunit-like protein
MPVHAALAQGLLDLGVRDLFGVIGEGNLYVVDSFSRVLGGRYVPAAHESGAVLMATGYAQISGEVGVATVTHGPGLTNAVTALVEAGRSQAPVLLIAGDVPESEPAHLQYIGQREVIAAAGAGFVGVDSAAGAREALDEAWRRARDERRPVVLDLPADLLWVETDYAGPLPLAAAGVAAGPDHEQLDVAVGLFAAANRPLVLAGAGARGPGAREAIRRLAAVRGALLGTTLRGKDLFADDPASVGVFGTFSHPAALDAIMASDCILAFGASLNEWTTAKGDLVRGKRVIHCDVDGARIGRTTPVDAALTGDAAQVAATMADWLEEADVSPSGFRSEAQLARLADYRAAWTARAEQAGAGPVDARVVLEYIGGRLPTDRTVVFDGGRFLYQAVPAVSAPPDGYAHALSFGAIGAGLATSIGAWAASPSRPVLHVSGDGGFMLGGLAELVTAVREKADLIVAVINDGSYGAEHVQFLNRAMPTDTAMTGWPDLEPVARALGARALTVRDLGDLPSVGAALADRDGPVLIDIKTDPMTMPTSVS